MTMMIPSATPVKISSSSDSKGLVNTGQLSTLLPLQSDVTAVMESVKRISDAKYAKVTAYTDPTLNAKALSATGTEACGYTKAAYVVDTYGNPASVNPDIDPIIVGSGGIFTTAEYQNSSDFQKTAAVMKLVIDGNAAAGTIEMGGFDYHSGNRADGEGKDFNVGVCIGACLEYAARKNKPVMIYVFSDGSLSSSGMIDSSAGGRGKGVWTGDNQNVAATYFLVFDPKAKPLARAKQSRNEPANRLLQFGRLVEHLGQPGRQRCVQPGADGGAQLHGTAWCASEVPDALCGPEPEQHVGYRLGARLVDRVSPDRERHERKNRIRRGGRSGHTVGSRCLNPETSYPAFRRL